jgi:hypothetical protein
MTESPDPLVEQGKELYSSAVNQVLAGYQLIEEMLKSYIATHFELTRAILAGRLHFDFHREDYQDAALGRLIQVFSKLTPNKALVSDLRSVVRHRDQIAHKSLLKLYQGDLRPDEYSKLIGELTSDMQRLSSLLNQIALETRNLKLT